MKGDGVEDGPHLRAPKKPLRGMIRDCNTVKIEDSLVRFVERVLPNFNLEVVAATRVPYISMGDLAESWYTQSDVLLVCKLKTDRPKKVDDVTQKMTRSTHNAVKAEL